MYTEWICNISNIIDTMFEQGRKKYTLKYFVELGAESLSSSEVSCMKKIEDSNLVCAEMYYIAVNC